MAIYSGAVRTTMTTATAPSAEIIAPAAARCRIMEIGIWLNAATQTPLIIGRPQAIGISPTTPYSLVAEDPNDAAAGSKLAIAWTTPPTVPLGSIFRRPNIAGAIGAGVILTFPRGLVLAAAGTLCFWNFAAVSVYDLHAVCDE